MPTLEICSGHVPLVGGPGRPRTLWRKYSMCPFWAGNTSVEDELESVAEERDSGFLSKICCLCDLTK